MPLLLGPPSSGKTTLLLALSGKLDKALKVTGKVTYNGHGMEEFVPQRTAAYISQYDVHIGEMTVRETLAFSARCQGVGSRYVTNSGWVVACKSGVRGNRCCLGSQEEHQCISKCIHGS